MSCKLKAFFTVILFSVDNLIQFAKCSDNCAVDNPLQAPSPSDFLLLDASRGAAGAVAGSGATDFLRRSLRSASSSFCNKVYMHYIF